MFHAQSFTLGTDGRGTYEITERVQQIVHESRVEQGLCNVFLHHTSASLILCENADPTVRHDLERYFARLVPDGSPEFRHTDEGPDDMPAHIRSILTQNSLSLPDRRRFLRPGDLARGLRLGTSHRPPPPPDHRHHPRLVQPSTPAPTPHPRC